VQTLPDKLEITGIPAHVMSWSVAGIRGFVVAVLKRWQRNYGELPHRFFMVMCPQVEVNAMGGLPLEVHALTDAKLTCRHFTGCHKPYLVIIFTAEDGDERRAAVQRELPWSEGYQVDLTESAVRLTFADATEELEGGERPAVRQRTLQELLKTGELVSVLA